MRRPMRNAQAFAGTGAYMTSNAEEVPSEGKDEFDQQQQQSRQGGGGPEASADGSSVSFWESFKARVWLFLRLLRALPVIVKVLLRVHVLCRSDAAKIRQAAHRWRTPVLDLAINRDPAVKQLALSLPVARTYPLMWQKREGYCGDATIQNVLASAGVCQLSNHQEPKPNTLHAMPAEIRSKIFNAKLEAQADDVSEKEERVPLTLPQDLPRYAESWLFNKDWSFHSKDLTRSQSWTVQSISASHGYDAFLNIVKRANDLNVRIIANYIRSPLLGLKELTTLQLIGGHFSPIIGYITQEDVVAAISRSSQTNESESGSVGFDGIGSEDGYVVLMDLNAKYGLMLVPAKQTFDTLATMDFLEGTVRGLIVLDMVQE